MVVTAVLITLAIGAAPAAAQAPPAGPKTPPGQAPAYTLSGVRRAAAEQDRHAGSRPVSPDVAAAVEAAAAEAAPPPPPAQRPRPRAGSLRKSAEKQIDLATATASTPAPRPGVRTDNRTVTTSLAPSGPAWHQEFLAMTGPPEAFSPFALMGNRERVEAVASSVVFALAANGVQRLVRRAAVSYRNAKAEKLRREIEAERLEVERQYRARKLTQPSQSAQGPPYSGR